MTSELSTYNETTLGNKSRTNFPTGNSVLSNNLLFGDRTYYRSKIFNTRLGINPLIAAAAPLFTLANQFSASIAPSDTHALYLDLQHEIKAFENNAQSQHYRSETILIARYLMCTLLDELILHSSWGEKSDWHQHPLLLFFHQEKSGDERFFVILERLSSDPALHIDLLEFIYLCLNCGFIGKFRDHPQGKETLEHLTNRLFDCIRWQRGELKKELNVLPQSNPRPPVVKMQMPLWLIAGFTAAVLLTIYSSLSYMLGNTSEQLYQQINPLLTQANNDH